MDFTIKTYKTFLVSLQQQGFSFQTFESYIQKSGQKVIILRHDVDLLPQNALKTAILENESGINGSYYFRIVPKSYNASIIKKVAETGHEIGYHYEDLTLAKGNVDKAYDSFCRNLKVFRKLSY